MINATPPAPMSAEEQNLMIALARAFRAVGKELLDKTPDVDPNGEEYPLL